MGHQSQWLKLSIASIIWLCTSNAIAQVEFLEQNWSEETRQSFYTTTQGSRMMPYEWFLALEVADSEKSFVKDLLPVLGYLPNDNTENNPDKLPVGFVLDINDLTKKRFVGLTCAACHTNQVQFKDKTFQIDGAPTQADMWAMLSGIDKSLRALKDDGDKYKRFATKVLAASPDMSDDDLKSEFHDFQEYWEQFIKDSTVKHEWGRGRLDAFGMIFNRVSSIDLDIPENSHKPNAPVSYPFLWGTSFQDRVQWNGSAENGNDVERLGRNVGEVLGVFAQAQFRPPSDFLEIPRPARTSAKRLNLVKLENQLKQLWSPQWPKEHMGEIELTKWGKGKLLYDKNCVKCHEVVRHGFQDTPVDVEMIPVSKVLTDPLMALNAATKTVSTGNLDKLFNGRERVPRGEMLQRLVRLAVISPYRDVAEGGLLSQLGTDDVFGPKEIKAFTRELGFGKSELEALVAAKQVKLKKYYADLRKTVVSVKRGVPKDAKDAPVVLKYKSAPLAGIWATAPYLHNGSVPNLYELLSPVSERSTTFHVGSPKFDAVKVGFETTETNGTTLFDTTKPGNSNAGHDMYGEFTEDERWQLIEYMKSL